MQKIQFDHRDQLEQPYPYENLPDSHYEKTTLYNRDFTVQSQPKLACDMLHSTFFKSETKEDLDYTLQRIEKLSNVQVTKIESVINKAQWNMHQMFAKSYNIQDKARQNYHGTKNPKYADEIAQHGFRGALCERRIWGKGIYSSSNPWEALSYCDVDENIFKLLILDVHVGPHTVGWQDRVDFGKDANGNAILTLTNPIGTIFCSMKEPQLLVKGIITVRYMYENKHTMEIQNYVKFYNEGLKKRIIDNNVRRIGAGAGAGSGSGYGSGAGAGAGAGAGYASVSVRGFASGSTVGSSVAGGSAVSGSVVRGSAASGYVIGDSVHGSVSIASSSASGTTATIWANSVGAPVIGSGFAIGGITNDIYEYVDSNHGIHIVGEEVLIDENLTKNKQCKKYEKFVDYRGKIRKIMAYGGKNFIFFVELLYDKDNKPVSNTTSSEIKELNGNGFKFLRGLDRRFLECLPCKLSHIQTKNDRNIKNAEFKRAKRTAAAMLNDTANQSGVKKVKNH